VASKIDRLARVPQLGWDGLRCLGDMLQKKDEHDEVIIWHCRGQPG